MPIPAYRAKQSTNTVGTGTLVLSAADPNARNFQTAFGAVSRRVLYMIQFATGYELGLGDYDGGFPGSLTRATVLASSNANALVTLPGGAKDVFAVFDPAAREVLGISGSATLALADLGNAVFFTGASASNLNLPAIATVPRGAGWMLRNAGFAALTIDPNGAETINGVATLVLQAGQGAFIFHNGSAWECIIAGGTATGLSLMAAADGPAVRSIAGAAPIPALSGVGTWQYITAAAGDPLVLPSGGTWAWFFLSFLASSSTWGGVYNAGISAGATTIAAGVANTIYVGFCWRTS